jgi:hypothetical protein
VHTFPQVSRAGSRGIAKKSRNVTMLIAKSMITIAITRRSTYPSKCYCTAATARST